MNRNLGRFIAATALGATLIISPTGAAMAGGDSTTPAALGCDDPRVEYDLKLGGEKRFDLGVLKVYERQNDGYNRWCVITKSGERTLGKYKRMSIKLAWHTPGERPVWPSSEGTTYDVGRFRDFAGSAYSTGRAGACLAIKGFLKLRSGKIVKRTVRSVYCYD